MKKIVLFLILTLNFSLLSGCPTTTTTTTTSPTPTPTPTAMSTLISSSIPTASILPSFTPCDPKKSSEPDNNFINMKCLAGNCLNGRGISTDSNGKKYEGNFKDGKLEGIGTLTYSNGSIYLGQFSNNEYNGKGLYIHCDNAQTYSEWKDGKQIGK